MAKIGQEQPKIRSQELSSNLTAVDRDETAEASATVSQHTLAELERHRLSKFDTQHDM